MSGIDRKLAADSWNTSLLQASAAHARELLAEIEYGPAVAAALAKVQTLLEADSVSVCLEEDGGGTAQHMLDAGKDVDYTLKSAKGATYPRLAEGSTLNRRAACATCRMQPHVAWCISTPLYAGDKQVGMLCAVRRPPRPAFGREHVQMLQFVAVYAGIALENARKVSASQQVQRSERDRIAAHLHDHAAQSLSLIGLKLEQAVLDPALPEKARLHLASVKNLSQQLMGQVRAAFGELRQSAPQSGDVVTALSICIDDFRRATQVPVEFSVAGIWALPSAAQEQAIQIVREALNNVGRHAHASRVQIKLLSDRKAVRIVVEDNGVGFDLHKVEEDQRHLGTILMRERAQRSGGKLEIVSRPGEGVRVTLTYPVTPEP